jgi:hypothetical protein
MGANNNHKDMQGVFDSLHRAGLADGPGCGQPEQGSNGATLLFDFYVPREPGWIEIVFDTVHKMHTATLLLLW